MQSHTWQLLKHRLIWNLKRDDLLGLYFQISEQLDLLHVKGTSIEDPAVQATVRLGKTLVYQINNDIVGNYKKRREQVLDYDTDVFETYRFDLKRCNF